jgi:hypothetical protein
MTTKRIQSHRGVVMADDVVQNNAHHQITTFHLTAQSSVHVQSREALTANTRLGMSCHGQQQYSSLGILLHPPACIDSPMLPRLISPMASPRSYQHTEYQS